MFSDLRILFLGGHRGLQRLEKQLKQWQATKKKKREKKTPKNNIKKYKSFFKVDNLARDCGISIW